MHPVVRMQGSAPAGTSADGHADRRSAESLELADPGQGGQVGQLDGDGCVRFTTGQVRVDLLHQLAKATGMPV